MSKRRRLGEANGQEKKKEDKMLESVKKKKKRVSMSNMKCRKSAKNKFKRLKAKEINNNVSTE